jgi:hypothetical protein
MFRQPEDDTSSLERARERLYKPRDVHARPRAELSASAERVLPREWKEDAPRQRALPRSVRRIRLAGIFFIAAVVFFIGSLGVAGYFFYYGGNSVSIDKITFDIQGPTTIAGGDTVPLLLTITNKNPTALEDATIEIDFPNGTRDARDMRVSYPRYIENLGTIASGATVTRSVKAVLFGGAGQALALPVSLSYGTAGSNSIFAKKFSYALAISTSPLSVSVDALTETVSNKPLTFTLTVRSNATVPIDNVVLAGTFPFGFSPTSSSLPMNNSSFLLGTLAPGANKTITLTGTLAGQDKEQRVFHFTVGTADTPKNQTLAVTYMTQDATVSIVAPFITATLALNGDPSDTAVVAPGSLQSITLSYKNTLPTIIADAAIVVAITGSAIDYASIRAEKGFYNSADRTIVFSKDTDPALASFAPGASGLGAFSFSTLPPGSLSQAPTVNLTVSVSGTRVGQSNVPEETSSSVTKTIRVATAVAFSAYALHASGPWSESGPIPPRADHATTYAIAWDVQNRTSAVADATVSATLPSYVSYVGITTGAGSFSYNEKSRTISWTVGDLASGASAKGFFKISLIPSTSQRGSAPPLTSEALFSGYDRFAGVRISATADPATTETLRDPGYVSANSLVQ